MKRLLLSILAALSFCSVFSQTTIKISGKLSHRPDSVAGLICLYPGHFTTNIQTIPISASGAFSYTIKPLDKEGLLPAQVLLQMASLEPLPLFTAPGYDLVITGDAANAGLFKRTLHITGVGSGINAYWKQVYDYRAKTGAHGNWLAMDEPAFLTHFTDDIAAVSAITKRVDPNNDDKNSATFKQLIEKQQRYKGAKQLYQYSFMHHYSFEQTEKLIKAAGFPDARQYLLQRSGLLTDEETRVLIKPANEPSPGAFDMEKWKDFISIQKERFLSNSLLAIRFGNKVPSTVYEGLHQTVIIDGKTPVELATFRISREHAADFRYRVVQNGNKELVSWTAPSQFRTTADKRLTYLYLGNFDYSPGQVLTAEIYNTKHPEQKDKLTVDWRAVQQPAIKFYANFQWKGYSGGLINEDMQQPLGEYSANFIVSAAPDIRFKLADSLQTLSFRREKTSKAYDYYVTLKRKTKVRTDEIDLGKLTNELVLQKIFWDQPGEYEIKFVPRLFKFGGSPSKDFTSQAETIHFTLLPADDTPTIFTLPVLIVLAVMLVLTALIVISLRIRQARRLTRAHQQKELATLQLRSVRSQLNPHFLFNALAGIQNLMNGNQPDTANLYLSKFARLTRYVLDDSENDLVSIAKEVALLTDYLEMEKMRSGFSYTFETDPLLDQENTEIPAMLLQPFVENAIKHGISELEKEGSIVIRFQSRGKDLLLSVKDNGKGMQKDTTVNGKGISLSKNRAELYNSIYKETTISVNITSGEEGTLVAIELKDWI